MRESVIALVEVSNHQPHCVVMKGNEVLCSDQTTHSRLSWEM